MRFLLLLHTLQTLAQPAMIENYYALSPEEFFALQEVQQTIHPGKFNKKLMEAAVFFASNEVRLQKRKSPFAHSSTLVKSSRLQSEYLTDLGTLDHLNKDKRLRTPMLRTEHFGGDFSATAENLARLSIFKIPQDGRNYVNESGQYVNQKNEPLKIHTYASLARKVVDGWMHSKGHRKNLMDDYHYLGCGVSTVAKSKDGVPEIYFTQNFGKK